LSVIHPDRRRLSKHARHLVKQMLRPRVATRGGTLQVHAAQLDRAVNPGRSQSADLTQHGTGVRTVVGPETRSLLRQLQTSKDVQVQRHLVREIVDQIRSRVRAAERRAAAIRKARERAAQAAQATGRAARATGRAAHGLWAGLVSLVTGVANRASGRRPVRVVGNRTTTRTRHSTTTRTRAAVGDGRATRTKKPAPERASRATRG
jgi:hypothetical protein